MIDERADVVIVGGGPAGSSAALMLARNGLAVVVLERTHMNALRLGETIPPGASIILRELGVWDAFTRDSHLASPGNTFLWAGDEMEEHEFVFQPFGTGWHLDRSRFDRTLLECAKAAGARVVLSARVDSQLGYSGTEWTLDFRCPTGRSRVRAPSLIDATGRSASCARRAGAGRLALDKLVCVASYGTPCDMDARTFLEATPEGWWYSALLPGASAVCALMTDADLLPSSRQCLARHWTEQLERAAGTRARIKHGELQQLRIHAAGTARLDRAAGPGWIAVGDAVLAYDPLSSLGIVKALESGQRAANAIIAQRRGDGSGLGEYLAWLDDGLAAYLLSYKHYYGLVRKWPASTFWNRRRAPPRC